jgi:large subunit ribosomal protein L17
MRHRKRGRQLGRDTDHRRALFRNMVTSLLEHEQIETTVAKAKELRAIADRMISLGKRGDLHSRRLASAYIQSKKVVAKLFSEIAPRFENRKGGYTRLIKTRFRPGDGASLSIVELVQDFIDLWDVRRVTSFQVGCRATLRRYFLPRGPHSLFAGFHPPSF